MSAFPTPQHTEHPPARTGFSVLPGGWYRGQISEIRNEQMKSGNGERTKVIVDIMSEGYVGRKAFLGINARHSNPTTEGIGQRQIDSLLEATGFTRTTLQSYVQLQRKYVLVKLKVKPPRPGYDEPENDLVAFDKPDAAHQLVPPPSRIGAPQGAGSTAPAWQGTAASAQGQGGQAPLWQGAQNSPVPAQQTAPAQQAPAEQAPAAPAAPAATGGGGSVPPWKR